MSEQEKPKNLCEEVADPAPKDPNWVPPWEDLPVKQVELSPVFTEVKLLTTLDPMDVSKLVDGLVDREAGTIEVGGHVGKIDGTGIVNDDATDLAALVEKTRARQAIIANAAVDDLLGQVAVLKQPTHLPLPILSAEKGPKIEVFGAEGLDPASLEYRDPAVTAASLMADTGMSAKELLANSSITDADARQGYSWTTTVNDPGIAAARHPADTSTVSDVHEPGIAAAAAPAEPAPVQEFTGEGEETESHALLPENMRTTSVPIPSDQLREYFTNKSIFYVVNYSESKLKGLPFLTYLTNLNVPADVTFGEQISYEDYSSLMLAYMGQMSITNLAMLNVMAAEMLLVAKGMPYENSPYALPIDGEIVTRFISENKDLVTKWTRFIDSTQVFGLSAIKRLKEHYKPEEFFEVVDDPEFIGCNVAQLYRIPEFIAYYFAIPGANYHLSYFKPQFEEFMFKNKRLSYYFRSRNNFAALMMEHLTAGTFKASDIGYGFFGVGVFDPAQGLVEYDAFSNKEKEQ